MRISLKNVWMVVVNFLCLVAVSFCGLGATVSVSVVNFAFVPASTNISAGDQVVWTWPSGSNQHNVTSTSVPQAWAWATTNLNGPASFTNTFPAAGSFPYQCTVHSFLGMAGTITVAAVSVPPSVAITNPADGAVFAAPANVTIQATASKNGGSVTNVQFRVGSAILTNETAAPYAVTTNNLAAGSYTLSAIATDNLGAKATNMVNISVVSPVTVVLTNPAAISGTGFQFSYLANTGLSYVVQRSSDLAPANWISLATNVAASNPVVFMDVQATTNLNFYRVGRLPNP